MSMDEMREFIEKNDFSLSLDEVDDLFTIARCYCCSPSNGNNG